MIKAGLVSDSHGRLDALRRAVEIMGDVDVIFHMGDCITDADEIRSWTSTPVMAVKGNMDAYVPNRPEYIETKLGEHKILAVHGHRQYVKCDYDDLATEAKARGCDIALFGHTHRPAYLKKDGITLINPGSCALPNGGEPTCAVMTLNGSDVWCEFLSVE